MHADDAQTQSEHVLPVGPVDEPVWHMLLLRHQPHVGPVVHVPHALLGEHGSVAAVHADEYQAQREHVPVVGPLADPCWHVLLEPHQPHDAREVQEPHIVASAHGSVVAAVHTPLVHVRPEQQSAVVVHV